MRNELLNKFSVIEFNIRELLRATEKIREEFDKGKYLSRDQITVFDEFYKLINQTLTVREVVMYLKLYENFFENKEVTIEERHSKYYPGGTKTFS